MSSIVCILGGLGGIRGPRLHGTRQVILGLRVRLQPLSDYFPDSSGCSLFQLLKLLGNIALKIPVWFSRSQVNNVQLINQRCLFSCCQTILKYGFEEKEKQINPQNFT